MLLPGYVVMELIQGCRNRMEQEKLQRELATYGVVWPAPADCDEALDVFTEYRLSHNAGLLDVLIGQTAVALGVSLYTFNQKHYQYLGISFDYPPAGSEYVTQRALQTVLGI